MKTDRMYLRISTEQKSALEAKAKEKGMTPSEAVRYLIQKWTEK